MNYKIIYIYMDIKEFLFNHRYIFIILVVLLFLSLLAYLILHFSGSNNKTISDVLDTNTPNIVKKLYCNDNLCLNNSSCVELLDDYKCICQYGYYGKNCNNYDIDEKEDEIDIDIYREEYIDRGRNRHHGNSPGPSPPGPSPPGPSPPGPSPPGPVPIPATPFKYNCCNTTYECLEDPNGSYTGENALQDCNSNCKRPDPTPVYLLDTCTQYGANKSPFKCKPSGSLKKNASNIECPKASNGAYYDCNYNLCCDDSPDPPKICPSNCSGKKCVVNCSGIITPTDCNKSFQKNGNSCIYHKTSHKCVEDPDERSCNNCSCTIAPPPPKTSCSDTNKCDATNSVSVDVDDYPELNNKKFNIRIKNTYSKPITIWLDDLPFAKSWITDIKKAQIGQRNLWTGTNEDYNSGVFTGLRNYTDSDTKIMGNNWESIDWQNDPNAPSVEKYSKKEKDGPWIPIKTDFKYRFFKLDVNDVLVITPPHSDIYLEENDIVKPVGTEPKPYQCFYQIGDCDMEGVNNWRGTCTSVDPKDKSWYQKIPPTEIDNLKTLVNASFSLNCGGSGMYITPCLPDEDLYDVIDTGGLSRIEYNINGGEIYFNLSAVDGINSDFDVAFNPGNKSLNTCDADRYSRKSEAIDNDKCPNKNALKFKNEYISSCQSIKYWKPDGTPDKDQLYPLVDGTGKTCSFSNQPDFLSNVKKVKLYNFKTPNRSEIPVPSIQNINDITAYLNGHNNIGETINASNLDSYLAKCPGGDAFTKTLCHLWWDDPKNDCAQQWINFASDPDKKQQYSWAYDEMKINTSMLSNDKTIPFDENGNPLINIPKNIPISNKNPNSMNDIVPLLHCQLADLTSNPTIDINISNIINSKDEYTSDQIAKCKSALGDDSMCDMSVPGDYCKPISDPNKSPSNCGHQYISGVPTSRFKTNNNYCLDTKTNICNADNTEQKCMSVPGNIWCEPCHMGIPFDDNVVTKKICNIPCTKGEPCPNSKKCDNTLCCDGL